MWHATNTHGKGGLKVWGWVCADSFKNNFK
jgi:hypothetical protein